MKSGKVAQLPEGAGTLVAHHASSLLVRKVYAKFWALVNDIPGDFFSLVYLVWPLPHVTTQLASSMWWPSGAVFITGTPGIGKSSMLLYILWQLAKAKRKVVLHTRDAMLLFSG